MSKKINLKNELKAILDSEGLTINDGVDVIEVLRGHPASAALISLYTRLKKSSKRINKREVCYDYGMV